MSPTQVRPCPTLDLHSICCYLTPPSLSIQTLPNPLTGLSYSRSLQLEVGSPGLSPLLSDQVTFDWLLVSRERASFSTSSRITTKLVEAWSISVRASGFPFWAISEHGNLVRRSSGASTLYKRLKLRIDVFLAHGLPVLQLPACLFSRFL